MKNVVLGLISLISVVAFGQGFDQSAKTLNLQVMLGYQASQPNYNNYYWGNNWGYNNTSSSSFLPGVMVSYDLGVHELISVAPYFYFQHSRYEGSFYNVSIPGYPSSVDNYKTGVNHFGFGARGLFHYGNMINGMSDITQLDLYGGLGIGSTLKTYSHDTDSGHDYFDTGAKFDFEYDIFAGARWYFSETFSANAEVGFGTSIGRLGITLKM